MSQYNGGTQLGEPLRFTTVGNAPFYLLLPILPVSCLLPFCSPKLVKIFFVAYYIFHFLKIVKYTQTLTRSHLQYFLLMLYIIFLLSKNISQNIKARNRTHIMSYQRQISNHRTNFNFTLIVIFIDIQINIIILIIYTYLTCISSKTS